MQVRGLTKKGKEFFRLTSSLTEPVARLGVTDGQLWAACGAVASRFEDGGDRGAYLAPERIAAMEVRADCALVCVHSQHLCLQTSRLYAHLAPCTHTHVSPRLLLPLPLAPRLHVQLLPLAGAGGGWQPVLACRDCVIRILGADGTPLFEVATASPPTALRCVP